MTMSSKAAGTSPKASCKRGTKGTVLFVPSSDNIFMAVIVGSGEYARFDKDTGIYAIPITALGA